FARGTGVLIAWLAVATLALGVVTAVVISAFGIAANGERPGGFFENAWQSLLRAMDPGTMGGDRGWGFRIVALAVTIGGILIVSILLRLLRRGSAHRLTHTHQGR